MALAFTKEEQTNGESYAHQQILKSSALFGGSSVLVAGIVMVRTKAMAVFLGPAGYGLFGVYGSLMNLAQCIAGLGVSSSGVRQIAQAASTGSDSQIACTAIVLRRVSIILGLLGAAILIGLSRPIAVLTFGVPQHTAAICLLAAAVFFQIVSNGQAALIRGLRSIHALAAINVLGTLFGTIVAISIVYMLRDNGIVPAIVGISLMALAVSWWFSHKVRIGRPVMKFADGRSQVASLLKLGTALMASGLITIGMAYVVRLMLLRIIGFEATGYYQSAWMLGGLYVGFILEAMGADYYPRLTANAGNNVACNRLANEQTLVGLLLAGPGVLATITMAPLLIKVFCSARFLAAVWVLRWICLGTTMQVITWPMSYILIAKGKQGLFFGTEIGWGAASLILSWTCIKTFGLSGAGIAFMASYLFYGVMLLAILKPLTGFQWSWLNVRTGLLYLGAITALFAMYYALPSSMATWLGVSATAACSFYSLYVLTQLLPRESIPVPIRRLLKVQQLPPATEP
jgi:PST family polysaccharide transporter